MLKNISTAFYDVMFGEENNVNTMNLVESKTLKKVRVILNTPEKLCEHIPALPAMLIRLLNTLKDPHSDVYTFIALVEQDPSFAAEVLKVANSAKYCRENKQILSLRRAISVLGLSGLSRIATTLLMADVIPCKPIYYKMFGRQIWLHSVQCATLCELLASHYQEDEFDAYFLGLIHDLGKIIIFNCLSETLGEVMASCVPGSKVYKELMTEMSMDITFFIAKEWQLPEVYCQALGQQRSQEHSSLAALLFKADKLSENFLLHLDGKSSEEEQQELLTLLSVDKNLWLNFVESAAELDLSIA